MWEKKLLVSLKNDWQEKWAGSTPFNSDLQVIAGKDNLRLVSRGYAQSKKIEDVNLYEEYWHYQAEAVDLSSIKNPRILILGFGGGTVGTLLKKKYPQATVDGVEIDPKMIELGKSYLDLKVQDFNIVISDADSYIKKTKEKYDHICVDLFIGPQTPKEVDSESFYERLKKLLTKKGQVSVNRLYEKAGRWERLDLFNVGEKEYKRFLKLFSKMFKNTKVIEVPSHFFSRNYIFVGGI